jgi:hypothetical protein
MGVSRSSEARQNATSLIRPFINSNCPLQIAGFRRTIARMQRPVLPNFFVVGTGKAGTTSLYHYLRQHPQIYMSPVKEPCYFASEIRVENLTPPPLRHIRRQSRKFQARLGAGKPVGPFGWLVSEWEDYVRLFQNVESQTAIGEASVAYLWSETASRNIAACTPNAKIIVILRDPSERAFSQYFHQLAMGLIHSSFRRHIDKCLRNKDRTISAYHPFLEVGLYHDQVKRYLEQFPRKNIRIYWYEEAWRQPQRLLADLFEFLDVDSAFCPDTSLKSLVRKSPRFPVMNYAVKQFEITHRFNELLPSWIRPAIRKLIFQRGRTVTMKPEDRQYLIDYYREDITKLASLLRRDLSAWLK